MLKLQSQISLCRKTQCNKNTSLPQRKKRKHRSSSKSEFRKKEAGAMSCSRSWQSSSLSSKNHCKPSPKQRSKPLKTSNFWLQLLPSKTLSWSPLICWQGLLACRATKQGKSKSSQRTLSTRWAKQTRRRSNSRRSKYQAFCQSFKYPDVELFFYSFLYVRHAKSLANESESRSWKSDLSLLDSELSPNGI